MAPRGRHKKPPTVGQTRMDAAIDALSPMGFHPKFIRQKVNALLKLYDGEWKMIEDSSYETLVLAILTEMDEQDENKNSEGMEDGDAASDGDEPSNETVKNGNSASHDAGPTNACDNAELFDVHDGAAPSVPPNHADPSSTRKTSEMLRTKWTKHEIPKHVSGRDSTCVPQAEERQEWKDIACMDQVLRQDTAKNTTNKDVTPHSEVTGLGLGENGSQGVDGLLPPKRRKPCYGWIGGEDEDEEDDFVFFGTEALQRKEMNRSIACKKDRKIRWDVMEKPL